MGLCKMEVVKLSCCINSVVLPQREYTNGSSPADAVRRSSTTQPQHADANMKSFHAGKNTGRTAPPGKAGEREREWKNLLWAEQHTSCPEKTSKLQVKQTKTDPEIRKV
ncbi:hypothetical protein DPX16_8539 [Anabarilius grahami]|uniref:Uncharacterized protein n=1 Tax=Anabarilius grahami TaxID=495550 RepID=A0A3N0Y976_ANAGA|nr:hypothetical protein DPX16_8539 [Anabarilius grahami]